MLPANATLINGVGVFSATFNTVGTQTFTATDTVNSTVTGSSTAIAVAAATSAVGTLFNTGVNASGTPLSDGTIGDPHYTLVSVPSGSTTAILVRTSAGGYPVDGEWMGDDALSAWIGPDNSGSDSGPVGNYDYRTTFDLTGLIPATASISGGWSVDNAGVNILINGVSTGNSDNNVNAFETFQSFSITSGFQPGLNTLDFIVDNTGGPTGLRVEATLQAQAGPAVHFTEAAPSQVGAGNPFVITVTAQNPNNSTDTGYTGTIHFSSSDGQAILPANTTLINGVGTFAVTLKTAGSQIIIATDVTTNTSAGTTNPISVSAAAATHFAISGPTSAVAGAAINLTVTAEDQFSNTATGYTGTVQFTSSDKQAMLPANGALAAGVGIFSITLKTPGSQTVVATDTNHDQHHRHQQRDHRGQPGDPFHSSKRGMAASLRELPLASPSPPWTRTMPRPWLTAVRCISRAATARPPSRPTPRCRTELARSLLP